MKPLRPAAVGLNAGTIAPLRRGCPSGSCARPSSTKPVSRAMSVNARSDRINRAGVLFSDAARDSLESGGMRSDRGGASKLVNRRQTRQVAAALTG